MYFQNILRGVAFQKGIEQLTHAFNFWLCFSFMHPVVTECPGVSEECTASIFRETKLDGRSKFFRNVRTFHYHAVQNPKMTTAIYHHRPKNLKTYKVAAFV